MKARRTSRPYHPTYVTSVTVTQGCSETNRRKCQCALQALLSKETDEDRIESWLASTNDAADAAIFPGGGEKYEENDDDDGNHSADGVAQGVSSDLTGAATV
jgi:hypothetical protein